MYLIVGGTGFLGRAVTRRLLAAGERVRIMTRNPGKADGLGADGAEIVQGDLLDRDSLERACHEAYVVIAAAHSILGRGKAASVHVDGQGHIDLINAAKSARVRHFLYTSIYDNGPAYHTIPFIRIKKVVEDYLRASGLDFTILRPTAFMEVHAHMLIGEPIIRNRRVVLFGRGESPRNFVAVDDVARIAVASVCRQSMVGETIDVGGPENLTTMDVVRLYESISGHAANVTRVPLGVLRVMYRILRPLHPGLSQVIQMGILADMFGQMFDAASPDPLIEFEPTRLADWISKTILPAAVAG